MVGVCGYQQRGGGGFDAGICDVCFGDGGACGLFRGLRLWMWQVCGCGEYVDVGGWAM